jgi:DNA repair exonuclease SbcCD ATPase subunit
LLRAHFPAVAVLSEAPLAAVSFVVGGAEDVAVSEALASIAGEPTHLVAFASGTPHPKWELAESLLVPTGPGTAGAAADEIVVARAELTAMTDQYRAGCQERYRAGCEERDGLREALMTAQDQLDRQDETLSSLRRETERHLRRSSEDAGAVEVAQLERERSDRRAASAERALEALSAQLRERTAQLTALEKELARVRGERLAERPDDRGDLPGAT